MNVSAFETMSTMCSSSPAVEWDRETVRGRWSWTCESNGDESARLRAGLTSEGTGRDGGRSTVAHGGVLTDESDAVEEEEEMDVRRREAVLKKRTESSSSDSSSESK